MITQTVKYSPAFKKMLLSKMGKSDNVRLEFRHSLRQIQEYAKNHHRFTSRKGRLEQSIDSRITSESPLVGEVFANPAIAKHGIFVSEGTKPHLITAKPGSVLRFQVGSKFVFTKAVDHPGTKADPFLEDALKTNLNKVKENVLFALEKEGL